MKFLKSELVTLLFFAKKYLEAGGGEFFILGPNEDENEMMQVTSLKAILKTGKGVVDLKKIPVN